MKKLLITPLFGLVFYAFPAHAQEQGVQLTVTPEQCVALHKGQTCYQEVLFEWKTPKDGRFCLINDGTRQQLVCWKGDYAEQYRYSFRGRKTTHFSLVPLGKEQPLAKVKVVVTWVYKAPKQSQSGWRLF
ncbi:hypothetical protein JCM19241_1157 [Vibrio ishigakensis]|uniref:DUF3019 domain-containing protein n=1 Tax=Vibrio ishigakensis TaxID=1481914 RepID=A0A0B8QJT4_9VIBR|nr:hypothetical protein JCM19241_1157 [Vibrio ishigakensis]